MDNGSLNPKCPNCGKETVWAGINRYFCENGCTAVGGFRPVFMAVVDGCKSKFKR